MPSPEYVISRPNGVGHRIINAIGSPKSVISLSLEIEINKPITATLKYYPTNKQLRKLPAILEKYRLQEIEQITEPHADA